jgi:hypothetical protein
MTTKDLVDRDFVNVIASFKRAAKNNRITDTQYYVLLLISAILKDKQTPTADLIVEWSAYLHYEQVNRVLKWLGDSKYIQATTSSYNGFSMYIPVNSYQLTDKGKRSLHSLNVILGRLQAKH